VGAAFAMMQLKAIFSILLPRFEFELAQPAESYGNDLSKMVVAVKQPCRVAYRRRVVQPSATTQPRAPRAEPVATGAYCVRADPDLCQGHGVCVNEAPDVFALDDETRVVRILDERPDADGRAAVESAVRHCPTRAIEIVED